MEPITPLAPGPVCYERDRPEIERPAAAGAVITKLSPLTAGIVMVSMPVSPRARTNECVSPLAQNLQRLVQSKFTGSQSAR